MSTPSAKDPDTDTLRFVIENVFVPPKLPQKDHSEQIEQRMNVALCGTLVSAALDFIRDVPTSQHPLWKKMIKMVELVGRVAEVPFEEVELQRTFSNMAIGGTPILPALSFTVHLTLSSDVFLMHIRAQNAALIVRRLGNFVQFEVFEVLPQNTAVMTTRGKLLCSYPGPAIQVPTDIFTDKCFSEELSSFLIRMDIDPLDSTPTTSKAGSVVEEVRESAHPRYISELLVGILRGCGQPAAVDRITKRIGDEVLWDNAYKPWRRSPLWLTIRVSLQSSLCTTNLYKPFMLFFHAYLLRRCVLRDFPSELLYAMRVKTTRRLSKLGPSVSSHVHEFVHDTFNETEALLSKRWTTFQAVESTRRALQPQGLDFVGDTEIILPNSYDYLTKIRLTSNGPSEPLGVKKKKKGPSTLSSATSQIRFTPSHVSRLRTLHDFRRFKDGQLADAIAKDRRIAITDFESTVETKLESWIASSTHNDDTPDVIASCIQQYYDGAKDHYRADAEGNSIMILTIMDLWVALDTSAIQQCPLLKQYFPEIPSDFLHPLLLHRSSTLKRALRIEEYLCRRHKEALETTSIFSNNISESSFAVKYFRASGDLQCLNFKINADAHQNRTKKHAELLNLNERSASLLEEAFSMNHEWEWDPMGDDWHNKNNCEKCQLERQARSMRICVHEWPLPRSTVHAQQAVFELSPPRAFSAWRDITYLILCDIASGLSPDPDAQGKPKGEALLESISGLYRWTATHQKDYRLTIASTTKSFSDQTHYQTIRIPAEESSVLVNNGLSFKLFDRVHKSWTMDSFASSNVLKMCTLQIPSSSPYSRLRRYLSGTQHTPNDVLTAQADCPKEINLHELVAFSGLRSGPRLQWLNIARELASPYLSFCREEVNILITQAAWQIGPLSYGVRSWHIDLNVPSFGDILLRELDSLLKRIGGNWLEEVTVRTIGVLDRYLSPRFLSHYTLALITSRLLASTTDPNISRRACELLREARKLTYQWISEVRKKLESTDDEPSCASLRHRLCMLAATCFSTFDVCSKYIPITLTSNEDYSIAIQCAVFVHDNMPSSLSGGHSIYLTQTISRHRRLLHYLEPIFSKSLLPGKEKSSHAAGFDQALARLWPGCRRRISSSWHALPSPNSQWISCVSRGGHEVHFDLLTGQLLINGKPLGRLPQQIVEDPTYASILGTVSGQIASFSDLF